MDWIVETGSLLVAAPDMLDPNFMHSVVLVVQHSSEGAYGLVINRPSTITLDVLLSDHPILSHQPFPVHAGGPVGLDTLQFLHRVPEEVPGGTEIGAGLVLGGDLEALARYIERDPAAARENVRMLLGYSGWGAQQLEGELSRGSWVPAALQADWAFQSDGHAVWRRVLRSLGRHAQGLEDLPPDVSWN
ncbi:MAG: YqgE/AlgH family protein [Planctomycetes bacterium]|nr:YqgE/AlgH family protein [Planctomycetota bacterium]